VITNERPLAADLLELCHRNGCTCDEVGTWDYGDPDPAGWQDYPDDWDHDEGCPLAMEIDLVLSVKQHRRGRPRDRCRCAVGAGAGHGRCR
jgi:hypothetical protein